MHVLDLFRNYLHVQLKIIYLPCLYNVHFLEGVKYAKSIVVVEYDFFLIVKEKWKW